MAFYRFQECRRLRHRSPKGYVCWNCMAVDRRSLSMGTVVRQAARQPISSSGSQIKLTTKGWETVLICIRGVPAN